MPLSHQISPKTVNDCIDILAYNEYMWEGFTPHNKDRQTISSLAESTYPWTEKQGGLALRVVKRYKTLFSKFDLDITKLCDKPIYRDPFRVIDYSLSIQKYEDEFGTWVEMRFPYDVKLIALMRCLKNNKGLPDGYLLYNGEEKKWVCKHVDVVVYWLTLIAIRYDFKFITEELLDEYDEIKKEKKEFNIPTVSFETGTISFKNITEGLEEHWNNTTKNKSDIIKIDMLKDFGFNVDLNTKNETLTNKVAFSSSTNYFINSTKYARDEMFEMFDNLDMFPLLVPVSGTPEHQTDVQEWLNWVGFLTSRYGENSFAFGFDIPQPQLPQKGNNDEEPFFARGKSEKWFEEEMEKYKPLYDLYLHVKSHKWIGNETKCIFIRNRIPKTLTVSEIKCKASLMTIGGGQWAPHSEIIKTMVDNTNKRVYYSTSSPIGENVTAL